MYLRTIKRKNKDGSVVEYVQLAHNVRHPQKGYPKAEVIHSFGRREQLDVDGLKRLVASIGRFIELDDPGAVAIAHPDTPSTTFISSQRVGGVYLLHGLWAQLKIGDWLKKEIERWPLSAAAERALFALVAAAALDLNPVGRTIAQVLSEDVFCGANRPIDARHVDQAVELLRGHTDIINQTISRAVAGRLNLNIDQIFVFLLFDPACSGTMDRLPPRGHRECGHRRDEQSPGPIVMAVSQAGIPLKSWLLPDNRIDDDFIQTVQMDLALWDSGRIVWVVDKQVSDNENYSGLKRAGGDYILVEKLRDNHVAKETERRKGRYKILGADLQIKATIVGEGTDRRQCVIASHPDQAKVDRNKREQTLQRLQNELERSTVRSKTGVVTGFRPDPAFKHYFKILKSGMPKIDISRVRQEEKHDGQYLLFSSDEGLPPETIAWGHKLLRDTKLAYYALKQSLPMRALGCWPDDEAGMLLSWMALLLMRIAEFQVGMPWLALSHEMQRLHLGKFCAGNRCVWQYTELTDAQKKILKRLHLNHPQIDSGD